MGIYERAAETSLRLLTKFGQDVTLRTVVSGAYNPATSASTVTNSDTTRKAVLLDFDRIQYGQTLRSGTQIQAGDRRCLMDANGAAPMLDSRILVGATNYGVIDIKELNPAGTPVLYDMLVRR